MQGERQVDIQDKELSAKQQKRLEHLAQLRMQRQTYGECAKVLKLSERQIKRLVKTPAYRQVFQEMQEFWDESTQATAKEAGMTGIKVLMMVCQQALDGQRPGSLAVVQAAKALCEFGGLGKETTVTIRDDREQAVKLALLIQERRRLKEGSVDAQVRELGPHED